jgi:hypothetical protein
VVSIRRYINDYLEREEERERRKSEKGAVSARHESGGSTERDSALTKGRPQPPRRLQFFLLTILRSSSTDTLAHRDPCCALLLRILQSPRLVTLDVRECGLRLTNRSLYLTHRTAKLRDPAAPCDPSQRVPCRAIFILLSTDRRNLSKVRLCL